MVKMLLEISYTNSMVGVHTSQATVLPSRVTHNKVPKQQATVTNLGFI